MRAALLCALAAGLVRAAPLGQRSLDAQLALIERDVVALEKMNTGRCEWELCIHNWVEYAGTWTEYWAQECLVAECKGCEECEENHREVDTPKEEQSPRSTYVKTCWALSKDYDACHSSYTKLSKLHWTRPWETKRAANTPYECHFYRAGTRTVCSMHSADELNKRYPNLEQHVEVQSGVDSSVKEVDTPKQASHEKSVDTLKQAIDSQVKETATTETVQVIVVSGLAGQRIEKASIAEMRAENKWLQSSAGFFLHKNPWETQKKDLAAYAKRVYKTDAQLDKDRWGKLPILDGDYYPIDMTHWKQKGSSAQIAWISFESHLLRFQALLGTPNGEWSIKDDDGRYYACATRERSVWLKKQFDAADTDKDNAVSYDELQAHLTAKDVESQLQQYVADAGLNAQTYFEKLDANQNGKVTLDEFVNGLRPMPHTCKPWKAIRETVDDSYHLSRWAYVEFIDGVRFYRENRVPPYASGPTGTPTLTIEDREIS